MKARWERAGLVVLAALAVTACTQHAPRAIRTQALEPYQCGSIQRLHTYQGIFLASQPSPADFEQARKGGVRTVINQRHESEITDFDERAIVKSLGLRYENPAWNGTAELTDEVIDHTRDLLNTAERPILMHCSSANRTGAVWLAYRALDGGLSWDEALAEAKTVGLKSPEYEAKVREYVQRRQEPVSLRPLGGIREIMQAKMGYVNGLFRAIVLHDFEQVAANADALTALSQESDWKVHTTLAYGVFSDRFRDVTGQIADLARRKDAEAVWAAYQHMQASCNECHAYLRKEGLFRYLPVQARLDEDATYATSSR
jgi:uncharacterized protein (TIGR01244 family)